jgi:hydrogenase nickel incorporation protein HypA/HybF
VHEYSLVSALVLKAEEEARARRATAVTRLRVSVGALAGVEPELLASAFTLCREGLLAGAALEIRSVAAAWACPRCDAAVPVGAVLRCAACGLPARLVSGDELLLEQIELEVP